MTKDIAYVVRLEENGETCWLSGNEAGEMFAAIGFDSAWHFFDENEVKDALRLYYSERHTMKESDRVFVCKVSISDCACFVKKDIDILLGK